MKMVMAVVPRDQAEEVLYALVQSGHTATFMESRGGVLRQAQKTLFVAVNEGELDDVLEIIRERCRSKVHVGETDERRFPFGGEEEHEAEVGGAAIWVWDIERFEVF
ncbi:MAG: cyclic-di-AMP receptor [Anaerolineae bacterium]